MTVAFAAEPQTGWDPARVSALIDQFFEQRSRSHGLYGLAFVMVRDGRVVLTRGCGHADPATRRPLDVNQAVLPVASIAKAFTATAVMQLVERGQLDLAADVNHYLQGVQLEAAFPEPVTIGHLLSHTEGFQEQNIGIVAVNEESLTSLGEFFSRQRPRRVLPPGQQITYGNWAAGLLGLVIEQVSGLPFDRYVEEQIFRPLGMSSSTFAQPAPAALATRCIREAVPGKDGKFTDAPHVYARMAPAGGMHASAPDMGRYMIAMTTDGACEGGRALGLTTVQRMRERVFTPHPDMPGITYGFFEEFRGARRVLRRDGDSAAAWSRIYLLPDEQTGFFFTVLGDEEARRELADALFGAPAEEHTGTGSALSADPKQYEGIYRYTQHNRDTFSKLQSLFVGQVKVKAATDGTLAVTALGAGDVYGGFEGTSHYRPAGSHLFQQRDGIGRIAFRANDQGRTTHLFSSMRYQGGFERLRWFETAPFHMAFLGVSALLWLGAAILFGLLPLFGMIGTGLPMTLMGLYSTVAAIFSLLLIPAIFLIGNVSGSFPSYGFGVNGWIRLTLTLPLVMLILTPGLLYGAWLSAPSALGATYWVLTALACFEVWWLRFWNLLGYRW